MVGRGAESLDKKLLGKERGESERAKENFLE